MTEAVSPTTGRIFMSYRREDAAYAAGWLYDRLVEHFGDSEVFKDVDSIEAGDDFVEVITAAVGSCDVLLALIGDRWLTIVDDQGHRRLDHPDDFVRREIEAALMRKVLVVPILVEGAEMPRAEALPPSLAPLGRRQALELRPSHFNYDTGRLLAVLEQTLVDVRAARVDDIDPARPVPRPAQRGGVLTAADTAGTTAQRLVQRKPMAGRSGVGGGVAIVVTMCLVIAVIGIVIVVARKPSSTASEPPAGSKPDGPALFQDDFSDDENRWIVSGNSSPTGRIADGTYRVTLGPTGDGAAAGAFPEVAVGVYPVAPSDVWIEVDGRRLSSSERQMEYGVACRANHVTGYGYWLTLSSQYAEITKSSPQDDYQPLAKGDHFVDPTAVNQLQAECTSQDGGEAVHLALWVNGLLAAEYVDRVTPLQTGGVGLWLGMDPSAQTNGEAEFDNFRVWG